MINRQFTRDELQQAFALAFVLHPSTEVALMVLIRAMKLATSLEQTEARRKRSQEHYKSPVPPEALLQFAVFGASLRWERDQESPLPKKEPRYEPTRDDLVVRYLKHLVWNNLVKADFSSLGIGLGCLLYDYKPKQIADFLGLSDELSIRRIKSSNKTQLMKRFNYADVLTPKGNAFRTTLANEYDRELVQKALKAFIPRNTTHVPLAPEQSLLEKLIEDSTLTDWDFKHSLLDPDCGGGMGALILKHNELYARYGEELEDPNLRLFLPEFDGSTTPPVDRFKAPKLTDNEVMLLNERHKSRADKVDDDEDDLLSDFYECGVDGSIIEVFDYSARSTNESPPLRVMSHGSYAKTSNIRILFLAAGGGAMGMREIETTGTNLMGGSDLTTEWGLRPMILVRDRMPFVSAVHPYSAELHLVGKILWDNIHVSITCGFMGHGRKAVSLLEVPSWSYRDVVCSTAEWNSFVPNENPTVWDFIKRSLSAELTQTWTNGSPFTNIYWVDNRKYAPTISNLPALRPFHKSRERCDSHQVCQVLQGYVIFEPDPQSPKIVFRKAKWLRPSGRLAVMTFHSMEHEQVKDLKPYVLKKELLMSDWYDGASARQLQDGYPPYSFRRRNATGVKKTRTWGAAPFPIWGIQMLANRASPGSSTNADADTDTGAR